jgi:hypothetical protein
MMHIESSAFERFEGALKMTADCVVSHSASFFDGFSEGADFGDSGDEDAAASFRKRFED